MLLKLRAIENDEFNFKKESIKNLSDIVEEIKNKEGIKNIDDDINKKNILDKMLSLSGGNSNETKGNENYSLNNDNKKIIKFENDRTKIPLEDYVNKLCEFLATLFDGLTADDLLNNLMLDEVQKIYRDCYQCYWDLLSGKFEELEKNSPTAEAAVI